MVHFFCKHASQLSEMSLEAVENFVQAIIGLITRETSSSFLRTRVEMYADAVKEKTYGLHNCTLFINGAAVDLVGPTGCKTEIVACTGHKKKHALKFQFVNSSDGLIVHANGPTEGRRHDWTLSVRSGLE